MGSGSKSQDGNILLYLWDEDLLCARVEEISLSITRFDGSKMDVSSAIALCCCAFQISCACTCTALVLVDREYKCCWLWWHHLNQNTSWLCLHVYHRVWCAALWHAPWLVIMLVLSAKTEYIREVGVEVVREHALTSLVNGFREVLYITKAQKWVQPLDQVVLQLLSICHIFPLFHPVST